MTSHANILFVSSIDRHRPFDVRVGKSKSVERVQPFRYAYERRSIRPHYIGFHMLFGVDGGAVAIVALCDTIQYDLRTAKNASLLTMCYLIGCKTALLAFWYSSMCSSWLCRKFSSGVYVKCLSI